MKTKWLTHILFILLLLFSVTLPLFERKHSDFEMVEDTFEYAAKKWAEGVWDFVSDAITTVKDKIIEEKSVTPKSRWEKFKNQLFTGYGFGVSSIGGTDKAWKNYKYEQYHAIPILTVCILIVTLFQILLINTLYNRKNPILAFINILLAVAIFGNCISDSTYDGLLYGSLLFVSIHIAYMLYFYYSSNKTTK